MKAFSVGIMLATLTFACGRHADQKSAVKALSSTANENLINEVAAGTDSGKNLKLSDVLAKQDYYGLSDAEVKTIRGTLTDDEYKKFVLTFVDPNKMRNKAAPRWAFLPKVTDDSNELSRIEVFNDGQNDGLIDGLRDSSKITYPVITMGYSEKIEGAIPLTLAEGQSASEGALMLNAVEFSDVQEPWIKGDAEMYAVVNFVGKDGKGTSVVAEMPSVNEAGKRYELRQILHMWPNNRFQVLNVAFFEHDSGYDYSALTKIFITAATTIVTSILDPTQTTTIAVAGIVGELAGKIVDALPKGTLTDDDDFVDTINTIEKYLPGLRSGVSANAKAEFSFYQVKINDE